MYSNSNPGWGEAPVILDVDAAARGTGSMHGWSLGGTHQLRGWREGVTVDRCQECGSRLHTGAPAKIETFLFQRPSTSLVVDHPKNSLYVLRTFAIRFLTRIAEYPRFLRETRCLQIAGAHDEPSVYTRIKKYGD